MTSEEKTLKEGIDLAFEAITCVTDEIKNIKRRLDKLEKQQNINQS